MVPTSRPPQPDRPPVSREALARASRIVVKVGTRVLTRDDGRPALSRLFAVVEQVADLHLAGREVLLVSSGAVGLGRERLQLEPPLSLADRQACAAVGQPRLMALYQQGFSRFGLECAQLLLTRGDFQSRLHYLSLRNTLGSLLRRRVLPVINENDAVSTDELADTDIGAGGGAGPVSSFGDNDQLSALVAAKLEATLLVMLTDVPGVFAHSGVAHAPRGSLLAEIDDEDLPALAPSIATAHSPISRGGMAGKLAAASLAARNGCHAVIASGFEPDTLRRIGAGEPCGTWFRARAGLAAKRRWIAFASSPRGQLFLDPGAVLAISERGASLLAAGVTRITGQFRRGDVVELCDARTGELVGRGIVHCDTAAALAWMRGERPNGVRNHDALVHRDNLALAEQPTRPNPA